MSRKKIFIQGLILIVVITVTNFFLTNYIFSKRIIEFKKGQTAAVRSIDHIFTALTYIERNPNGEFNDKIKQELDEARAFLRAPELLKIRRKRP